VYTLFGPYFPLPPTPLSCRPNLFCLFLQFCWREDKSNDKKNIAFLLVEIRTAIQRDFVALLPYTSILQPELIHLFLTSSLLPGHLPILTSVILRLLF
jgi:hypothetical protein